MAENSAPITTSYSERFGTVGSYIGAASGAAVGFLASTQPLAGLAALWGFQSAAVALTAVGSTAVAAAASTLVIPLAIVAAVGCVGLAFFGRNGFLGTLGLVGTAAASTATIRSQVEGSSGGTPVSPDTFSFAGASLLKPLVCAVGASFIGGLVGRSVGALCDRLWTKPQQLQL